MLLVGIDVGAETSTDCPTTTEALRTAVIEDRAAGVNKAGTPMSIEARIKFFENFPLETEVEIVVDKDEVKSAGVENDCPSKLLRIEKEIFSFCDAVGEGVGVGVGTDCNEISRFPFITFAFLARFEIDRAPM